MHETAALNPTPAAVQHQSPLSNNVQPYAGLSRGELFSIVSKRRGHSIGLERLEAEDLTAMLEYHQVSAMLILH